MKANYECTYEIKRLAVYHHSEATSAECNISDSISNVVGDALTD